MGLFVDGPGCTIEDLIAHDSALLDVAETEGIDVTRKIQLAMEEITPEIQLWLDRPRGAVDSFSPFRCFRMEQVVVTPVLKRWLVMYSLTLVYRDAYFCQLVDRFQAKWNEYSRLSRSAQEQFVGAGLGMVSDPVRKADIPLVSTGIGPQPGGTYYTVVTYLNAKGQEGAPSDAASLTVSDGVVMTVSPVGRPLRWNVYGGTSLDELKLQNSLPLSTGDTWTYVPGAFVSDSGPGKGQAPEFTLQLTRTWMRG